MARMWVLVILLLISMLSLANAEACEDIPSLPQCAANCLPPFVCSGTKQTLCEAEYEGITSCYENNCQLREYLYSMNITNAVCDVPPRSRQATQIGVGSSFIALTTIIMGLRMAGRPPFSAAFGIDDVVGFVTFVTAMVDTAIMIAGARLGWGTDMWALTQAQIISQMKLFYVGIIFFYFSVSVAKLAILFFYLRIFTTRTFKRVTYGLIALCSAYSVAVVFQSAFDCTPASYYWTRFDGVSDGACLDYAAFKVMPPLNIALDVVVMLLPLPLLLKLNLPLAKKIRVISMFSVGILIIIAGILRLSHLYHSITTYNITYNGGEISYYGVIEADVSVMCTCMPAIAALLKRLLPRWFASSRETYPTYQMAPSTRGTFRSSTNHTKPVSESAEDINLIPVVPDDSPVQRPQRCLRPR